MSVRINDIAPDFTAESTAGTINFHQWLGDSYGIVFSHPRDFTPVCTTEFGAVAQLAPEWAKRNTKVLGVSVDSVGDHQKWKRDIEAFGGAPADFPIIDDSSLAVAKAYDMLPADYYLPTEGRTPAHSATVRTVYIIGPDKKVRLTMTYPMSVGRNFAEILRALDAVQATDGVPLASLTRWGSGSPHLLNVNSEVCFLRFENLLTERDPAKVVMTTWPEGGTGLQVPHPYLHQRAFVLVPLHEIAPGLVTTDMRKAVSEQAIQRV